MMQRRVLITVFSWLIANAHGQQTSITSPSETALPLPGTLTPTLQTEAITPTDAIVSPAPDSSVVESPTPSVSSTSSSTNAVPLPVGAEPINWNQIMVNPPRLNLQSNLGSCPCDLTAFSCDINCCCDPDCKGRNNTFTSKGGCLAEPDMRPVAPLCSSFLLKVNNLAALGASTLRNSDGVVCVVYNNSPIKGFFYEDYGKTFEKDSFFTGQFQRVPYNYSIPKYTIDPGYDIVSTGLTNKSTSYELGDTVLASFPGLKNTYGPMFIPSAGLSTMCNDGNPLKFLISESSSCNRPLISETGQALCTNNSFFDANYYLSGYRIVTGVDDSAYIDISGTECDEPFSNNKVRCTDILPVWDPATRACFNMVTSVRLSFFYNITENRGAVILGARASVQLGNAIASARTPLVTQSFDINWIQVGTNPKPRSGNPGYIVGKPILSGTYIAQPSPAVALYADPIDGITLPMDAPTGPDSAPYFACSTSPTNRVPINFGEDISGGCTLVISFADISNATGCNAIRRTALNAQTSFGKLLAINRIGQFGNANSTNPNDWVTILTKDVGEKDFLPSEPGTCTGVLTSLDIQILTADFGSTKNPQPGIIGLRILYNWNKIVFRCLRPLDCQLSDRTTTQRFRLRSTVTYFRVPNQGAKPFIPPSPRLIPLLPDDLFYPFRLPPSGSFAGRNMAGRVGIGLALVIILLLRL